MPFCVVLSLISAAARGGGTPLFWSPFSERILLARCDGFALGGLLAAALAEAEQRPRLPRPLKPVLGLTAAFALAYLVVGYLFYGGVRYIGLPTPSSPGSTIYAFNLLFLGMVGLVTTSSGHWVLAPLRLRPLVYLGQISYALYLYHFPIYCAIDGWEIAHDQILLNAAIKLGTSVAAAGVSWSFIEGPILRLKERFRYDGRPPDSEAGVLRTGDLLESR